MRVFKRNTDKRRVSSWVFLPITLALAGLFFVFEASSVRGFNEMGDSFYFFKFQFLWLVIGIGVMLFLSYFDYHKWYYLSFLLMIATLALLSAVLIPGIGSEAGGARRWIDFGIINFQPTEIAKFSVIIYLSSWFLYKERKRFSSFIFLLGLLVLLIMLQPDMGTTIIVFSLSIIMYFLAGVQISYLFIFLPIATFLFFLLIKISNYRFQRITAFLNPQTDPLGVGYHINQILISLGNGGLLGQGFGVSRQKFLFLPEAHTDSIFAIISEEFGFIGSLILICAFFLLIYKIYQVAIKAPDKFGKFLAAGIFSYFALQIGINLGGMVNLIPLTGVSLPFISYGGSNLLISFTLLGIIFNIARKARI